MLSRRFIAIPCFTGKPRRPSRLFTAWPERPVQRALAIPAKILPVKSKPLPLRKRLLWIKRQSAPSDPSRRQPPREPNWPLRSCHRFYRTSALKFGSIQPSEALPLPGWAGSEGSGIYASCSTIRGRFAPSRWGRKTFSSKSEISTLEKEK